jgi:hypothetical protein
MTRSSFRHSLASSCCCALLLAASSSQAQAAINTPPAIVAIETASASVHADLRIVLDRQLAVAPEHFPLRDPARIVIDLPASTNATGTRHADFNFPADSPLARLLGYGSARASSSIWRRQQTTRSAPKHMQSSSVSRYRQPQTHRKIGLSS